MEYSMPGTSRTLSTVRKQIYKIYLNFHMCSRLSNESYFPNIRSVLCQQIKNIARVSLGQSTFEQDLNRTSLYSTANNRDLTL